MQNRDDPIKYTRKYLKKEWNFISRLTFSRYLGMYLVVAF